MAGVFKGLFGEKAPSKDKPVPKEDADFADFAGAPEPTPASIASEIPSPASTGSTFPTASLTGQPVIYTKWYRVWERTSPQDFYVEGFILFFIIVLGFAHVWGTRKNRKIAKQWFSNYAPILESEFAVVGYGGRKSPSVEDVDTMGLAKAAVSDHLNTPTFDLKENSPQEFASYATGRQNIAVLDSNISLAKRYNPLLWFVESALGYFFDSLAMQGEVFRATIFPFDGKESDLVPLPGGKVGSEILEARAKSGSSSSYDDFIWAVVNKDYMKTFRDERYDVSLTSTKENAKLPVWATVMTESAEITDTLLTPELIKAVEECGDSFEYLLVSDQPMDKPLKLEETTPKKRLTLSIKIDSSKTSESTKRLFSYFIRLTDQLVSHARFRPEVTRKVRQVREDEIRKLQRAGEEEKAEERNTKRDKEKKEKRDALLKGLSADEQRKFLDREREKELRKSQKKMTKKVG